MKTTDLIPLILYELSYGDKYGFELSKAVEQKSNGRISIKQATLYTILKKLEKSKFISSYWQDSEIGGKRHYYKLTQNGNLQLSTMPKIEVIIENLLQNNEPEELEPAFENENALQNNNDSLKEEVFNSFDDRKTETFTNQQNLKEETDFYSLKESVLPTNEVFNDTQLDKMTETELNLNNAEFLKNDNFSISAKNTEKFAEVQNEPTFIFNNSANQTFKTLNQPVSNLNTNIPFVEYVNFKQDAKYLNAKKIAKKMLLKVFCSSAYLLMMLVICGVVTNFTGKSNIFNVFLIAGIIVVVFYPILFAVGYEKFRLKCQSGLFKNDIKKQIIISITSFLIILVVLIILNISLGKNSLKSLFEIQNFANLYAPMIISSFLFADLIFNFLLIQKNK